MRGGGVWNCRRGAGKGVGIRGDIDMGGDIQNEENQAEEDQGIGKRKDILKNVSIGKPHEKDPH